MKQEATNDQSCTSESAGCSKVLGESASTMASRLRGVVDCFRLLRPTPPAAALELGKEGSCWDTFGNVSQLSLREDEALFPEIPRISLPPLAARTAP